MWWKTLGVTPDADIEAIKKAYSTLIKEYRPEQYPEQFSQIRQAFEVARKQAPKKAIGKTKAVTRKPNAETESVDVTEENPILTVVAQTSADTIPPDAMEKPVRITIESQPAQSQSYTPPAKKEQPTEESIINLLEQWKLSKYKNQQYIERILNHPHTYDIYELKQAGHQVFSWLIQNIKPATGILDTSITNPVKEVARLNSLFGWSLKLALSINMPVKELARLNDLFGWSLKERDLYEQYPAHDLSLVFLGIASGQSAHLHRNPIAMQKAEEKKKDKYAVIEMVVLLNTGLLLLYFLTMTVEFIGISFTKGKYLHLTSILILLFVLVDGLFYGFKNLRKAGILRPMMITRKSKMWALIFEQLLFGLITSTVIITLEAFTLFMVYSLGKGLILNKDPLLWLFLLPLLYMTYKLSKAIFPYSKMRYFKLIRELKQIRINSKK